MIEYMKLLARVLLKVNKRQTRAGPTHAVFGEQIALDMMDGFPIISSRAVPYKAVLGELAAFMTGSTKLSVFKEFGCNYWDANAKAWNQDGDVGKIYGYQWRRWNGKHDQVAALVDGLRRDPGSRRHILTTWNPTDLPDMCLPPCHLLAQFHVRQQHLDCLVYMRSVDLCLGLPADMVLYGALLVVIAAEVGRVPGNLKFFFGDAHIYENHLPQMATQVLRTPRPRPTWRYAGKGLEFKPADLELDNYNPHDPIAYKLNV